MFSFMNILRVLLTKLITGLYVFLSIFGAGLPIGNCELPKTPDNFTPVLRFAVTSDVHLNGEKDSKEEARLREMIQYMYSYSESQEYKNFDALCVAGDFTDQGKDFQYDLFNKIISEELDQTKTQLLICTGNHEYINTREYDASLSEDMFVEKMQREPDTHVTINGYHFILASYCDDGKTFTDKCSWIDDQLKIAKNDTGDKPIFTFQHPAPFATIYGSISWGDFSIPSVYLKYPQVVNFSGHSHYPINDPRSIWQGGFTALGCGTLSYYETDLDYISGNFPYDEDQAAQFNIVEVDADGNVRVIPYDLITDTAFDNEYYLTNLGKRNFDYSFARMKKLDEAPVFEGNGNISRYINDNGETVICFDGAKDKFVVESYKMSVTENGLKFYEDNFSGKYMYKFMEDTYEVVIGKTEAGKKYNVQIVAFNAYGEGSTPLSYSFVG